MLTMINLCVFRFIHISRMLKCKFTAKMKKKSEKYMNAICTGDSNLTSAFKLLRTSREAMEDHSEHPPVARPADSL